ncbi:MAG TPA: GNAT family N-acetyltransferase [Ktedonosporobacter sp.]|jgi:ribosomal protein S18 acetylase RimI-like enzyme|nr:GNAT family N-acetyltransferase [Ktedonosporobacter sp.]
MADGQAQELVAKQRLNEVELAEIRQLTDICDSHEGLHMRILWDMLQSRPGIEVNDFLYYEGKTLAGYLAMDSWGIEKRELTGMVHPEYRRKGIGRALLNAAREECSSRGIKQVILVCERTSASGQAFVRAVGGRLDFSEHEMVLGNFQERNLFDDRLFFRAADSADLEALAAIQAGSFGDPLEEARLGQSKHLQEPNSYTYIATFGEESVGCEEPVGALRLHEAQDRVGIYGFGVLPDYRGRGYGRQMLEEAIRSIRARSQKMITLDVETDNVNAIGLYCSCGFEIKTTYDYYAIDAQQA